MIIITNNLFSFSNSINTPIYSYSFIRINYIITSFTSTSLLTHTHSHPIPILHSILNTLHSFKHSSFNILLTWREIHHSLPFIPFNSYSLQQPLLNHLIPHSCPNHSTTEIYISIHKPRGSLPHFHSFHFILLFVLTYNYHVECYCSL